MSVLGGVLLTTCMLLATWGGWRLGLRSLCASEQWRREVRRESEGLKTQSLWMLQAPLPPACSAQMPVWDFPKKLVGNQQGSVEVLGIGLLLGLAFLLVVQGLSWRKRHLEMEEHFKQTLCLKAVVGETQRLIGEVGKLNAAIKAGEVTSWGLVLLGGIGLVVKPQWEKVKKALQLAQEISWGRSMLELKKLRGQGCRIPLTAWTTPYEWQGTLKRRADGQALSRTSAQWFWQTPLVLFSVRWSLPSSAATKATWMVN